jgi:peptide/nickel transport system ATP-binding protein
VSSSGAALQDELILEVRDLAVDYGFDPGTALHALVSVDLTLHRGEVLGIAGESGSGKSTLAAAVTRLLRPPGRVVSGSVSYRPKAGPLIDVFALAGEPLRKWRWNEVSVVFQAAMNSLNPVASVAAQLMDALEVHRPEMSADARRARARELVALVGIPESRLSSYPHQLSGGMRQRVMIAMALALDPEIVIMDEPTTALDVVVQREILVRMSELRERLGFSVIFITHDLSLLLEMADTIAVMYAGKVVEAAPADELYDSPSHPYTRGLLASFPSLVGPRRELVGLPGSPPDLRSVPSGCAYHPRCPEAEPICSEIVPSTTVWGRRTVVCHVRQRELSVGPPAPEIDREPAFEATAPEARDA